MKEYNEIKPLLNQILRLYGNGYKYLSINEIPQNKQKKREKIKSKLTKKYNLDLTTWQRQYKKRKGEANFYGLIYNNTIILLSTEGQTRLRDKTFKKGSKIAIKLTNYLEVILYTDEREKLTYRLNKELIRQYKANIDLALKNKKGYAFHKELNKIYNLHKIMPYRGFMLQVKDILLFIKDKQKKYKTNYTVPAFFK